MKKLIRSRGTLLSYEAEKLLRMLNKTESGKDLKFKNGDINLLEFRIKKGAKLVRGLTFLKNKRTKEIAKSLGLSSWKRTQDIGGFVVLSKRLWALESLILPNI